MSEHVYVCECPLVFLIVSEFEVYVCVIHHSYKINYFIYLNFHKPPLLHPPTPHSHFHIGVQLVQTKLNVTSIPLYLLSLCIISIMSLVIVHCATLFSFLFDVQAEKTFGNMFSRLRHAHLLSFITLALMSDCKH